MSERLRPIRRAIDWGELAPLRLRARQVAEGVYAGHAPQRPPRRRRRVRRLPRVRRRATTCGGSIAARCCGTSASSCGSSRPRPTATLCLLVDASASMGFRGPRAPGAKLAFAAVVAAALARIALASGDPVSLTLLGGGRTRARCRARAGASSSSASWRRSRRSMPAGDVHVDAGACSIALCRRSRVATRRGAIVVVLSDLIDLPPEAAERDRGHRAGRPRARRGADARPGGGGLPLRRARAAARARGRRGRRDRRRHDARALPRRDGGAHAGSGARRWFATAGAFSLSRAPTTRSAR